MLGELSRQCGKKDILALVRLSCGCEACGFGSKRSAQMGFQVFYYVKNIPGCIFVCGRASRPPGCCRPGL